MSVLVGVVFIWLINYTSYESIVFSQWKTTAFPTAFYAGGIVFAVIKYLDIRKGTLLISLIGRASYHIFLFQMFWYGYISGLFLALMRVVFTNHYIQYGILSIVSIVLCLIGGVIFYILEEKIINKNDIILRTYISGLDSSENDDSNYRSI